MKQGGLGARFLCGGYDISGNVSALDGVGGGPALQDVTDITQSVRSRIGLLRDGKLNFTSFWDALDSTPVLDALPRTDVLMSFLLPPLSAGSPAACLNAKQVNYDPSRSASGELTLKTEGDGQGYGIEWGQALTPGIRSDTAATDGTALDNGASTAFGAQMYLQVTQMTGTTATITVEHSADNSTWAALAAFTAVTAAPAAQRITVSSTTTVDRYVRVSSSGTFTSLEFFAALMRNPVGGVRF